jgi:D-glycero-alpha-D-manno-heptose-7-phosphate kinase
MRITAKAPCRVDLAGGTLDIWPLYLFHPGAVTVNFAIDVYAHCTIEERQDKRILLRSEDFSEEEAFGSLDELRLRAKHRLPLAAKLVSFFAPRSGIRVVTNSEAPAGAGLAGSSTLLIATAGALERLSGVHYAKEQLRETVQNVEAQIIGVPTGCQDYYPAMHGGVNAVELRPDGVRRRRLAVDARELGERVVLAYTGAPRQSGINNWEVMKAHINGDRRVHRNFDEITSIARGMVDALEKADWGETGRLLREEWAHRRRNSPGITTPLIDRLVGAARRNGATGAKVCGAGGGGCVVFLVEKGSSQRVSAAVAQAGGRVIPVRVARGGLRVTAVPQ